MIITVDKICLKVREIYHKINVTILQTVPMV